MPITRPVITTVQYPTGTFNSQYPTGVYNNNQYPNSYSYPSNNMAYSNNQYQGYSQPPPQQSFYSAFGNNPTAYQSNAENKL